MAISAATLRVDVDMNTGAAERQLTGFGQKLSGFAAGAARAGSAMFTGLAMGAGIALFNGIVASAGNAVRSLGGAVEAASDLGETISMVRVVMGDWGDDVVHWSENSAKALGMTQNAALMAAGTFAAFGKSAKMSGDELTGFSTDLVGLAADLGSFYNTSPEEAITAIGAALRGESEPIRRYNVLLDDMTLRQAAVKLGIIETTKEALTPQQRVLAATSELWRQTGDAQGDFARTSGNLAGQQKVLTANMDALSVTLGNALLPAMTAFTTAGNQLVEAVLPNIGNIITTYLVPAMTDLATYIGEAGVKFGQFLATVAAGGDPVGAFVAAFNLTPVVTAMNGVVIAAENMAMQVQAAFNAALFAMNEFIGNAVREYNRMVWNMRDVGIGGLDEMRHSNWVTNPENFTPTALGLTTIATSGWGADAGHVSGMGGAADLAGVAARAAADTAAAAAANGAAGALKGTFSPATIAAARSVGGLGDSAKKAADELETALRGVPGLFGTSSVTSGDMAKAAAGLPVNFADDYVRRVGDELLNGVNLADIDPAEVAASLGMDPSVPAELIYNELVRQWGSGEYFANPDNVAKINWTAVQAKLDQDARAVLGESNILAGAIAAGITLESMAPVATATVAGMTGALAESNLGAATGATAIAAMATPDAIEKFEASGASAAGSWMNGWHTAVDGWIPPMPATTTTPLVENPFGAPPTPITVDSFASPGPGRPVPGSRSGTVSGGNVWNITINGVDASKAGAVGNAAKNAVLDALRARGQV